MAIFDFLRARLKDRLRTYANRYKMLMKIRRCLSFQWFKIKLFIVVTWSKLVKKRINAASLIIDQYEGRTAPAIKNRKVCIFAHFDPHDSVDTYVMAYINSLYDLGFEILFVSSAVKLQQEDIEALKQKCIKIIVKENIGYDFGSWKIGIDAIGDCSDCVQIVLANDSVYGPLFPLQEMFEVMNARSCDFWGVTDSYELGYHIQSYFLVFGRNIIRSPAFQQYWESYDFHTSKWVVVHQYEIGTTKRFMREFKVDAYCRYNEIVANHLMQNPHDRFRKRMLAGRTNPMHFFWRELIIDHRCPFIKRELLRFNPVGIAGIKGWFDMIKNHTAYDPLLITNHLQRIGVGKNYEL